MTPDVLALLQGLTEQQKNYVLSAQARQKETGMAYLFWFVLGVHYFYLNKPFINIIETMNCIVSAFFQYFNML